MKTRITAMLTLGLLACLASVADAQPAVRGERRSIVQLGRGLSAMVLNDTALDRFADRIELNDEQRGQLQAIAQAFRTDNADALSRLERMRAELRALRDSTERPTRDAIEEVLERYGDPDLDIARAERQLGRDLTAILTPEQERRVARGFRGRARVRQMAPPRRLPRRVAPFRRRMSGLRYAPGRPIRQLPRRIRRP